MIIFKIIGLAFIATFLFLLFKDRRNDIALIISLVSGIIIFALIVGELAGIIEFLREISNKAGLDIVYIGIVMKIIAIAYLSSFASEICKDAGASSIGSKVEFAGKIMILGLAVPILMAVLDSILNIL